MRISRTDFVPDGKRAVLVGLKFAAGAADENFTLKMDAHSELMGAYPWGETNPSQTTFNLEDSVTVEGGKLVFREQGTPVPNALRHDWAAVVGLEPHPDRRQTGRGTYRGPQDPPTVICPASARTRAGPTRCDDTAYGKGKGGQLRYRVSVPAEHQEPCGSQCPAPTSTGRTRPTRRTRPWSTKRAQQARRSARTRSPTGSSCRSKPGSTCPGTAAETSIDWSKQNLADSVQIARDLEIRETNAGKNYPRRRGRWIGCASSALASPTITGSSAPTASTPPSPASGSGSSIP